MLGIVAFDQHLESAPLLPPTGMLPVQRLTELQGTEKGALHQRWKAFDRGTLKPLLGGRLPPGGSAGGSLLSRDTEYQALSEEQEGDGPAEVRPGLPFRAAAALRPAMWVQTAPDAGTAQTALTASATCSTRRSRRAEEHVCLSMKMADNALLVTWTLPCSTSYKQ